MGARIGIGLGHGPDAAKAAREAVRRAKRAVARPGLALAFGGVRLDQRAVHAALCRELDPSILIGGSSYAEITPAGVSRDSVAVLLLDVPGAEFRLAGARGEADPARAGAALARQIGRTSDHRPLGLLLSAARENLDDGFLRALHRGLPGMPFFGGLTSGDYDAGMGGAGFWRNWQYEGARLERSSSRLALMEMPDGARAGFGFDHGWTPVGPVARVTRARGGRVHEVDGMSAVEYYRQFFGDGPRERMLRSIQRHAFALRLEGDYEGKTLLKLPVRIDFRRGWIDYLPPEELQGRSVQLLSATRVGLVGGAREAARRALDALKGRRPALVLAVSCCTRGRFLNSRAQAEMEAARGVFGPDVPLFGYYSGGELFPFLSRYEEAADPSIPFGGSYFHTATVGFLALSLPGRARVSVPPRRAEPPAPRALAYGEEALDDTELFLSNLSRKTVGDAEKLRRQTEVIRRYTPHGVWRAVGARAARGVYEIADAAFDGVFLFMDVKGFTAFSERHAPGEVVAALNRVLGPATDLIHACGGDVDKFVGDCIFAAFRRPADAVEAGRRVLAHVAGQAARGGPFSVRIGINAGRAIRANVGSADRREYTYIGDAVNLAQRLESNAAPGAMLVSAGVYAAVRRRWPRARRRRLTVKGKAKAVTAYELPGALNEAAGPPSRPRGGAGRPARAGRGPEAPRRRSPGA